MRGAVEFWAVHGSGATMRAAVEALVTPGVRSAGAAQGDQKRVATPAEAIRNGEIIWSSAGKRRAPKTRAPPANRS